MSKKLNISQLGRDFQKTKSQKTFKQIFDLCKPGIMNHYKKFNNSVEAIEDAYNESMISIWADIDKLDVTKYSISTMIYLKTKQKLIRANKLAQDSAETSYSMENASTLYKVHAESDELVSNVEEEYIVDENVATLWDSVKDLLDDDLSYNILYDTFVEKLSGKDIADKYNVNTQTVANRIFQAKKKIGKANTIKDEYID